MRPFTLDWTVTAADDGTLVKQFLASQTISKAALTDIKFKGGHILVNDVEVTVRHKLVLGDNVKVIFPAEEVSDSLLAENISLSIVYEDDYLLVIEKAAGMSTIPSREHPHGSVANGIVYHYAKQNLASTVHIVTRLDRDTSGLLLIAKHRHIHHLLSIAQRQGEVNRSYEALVHGLVEENGGIVEKPIARKTSSIIEREVNENGQYACTQYEKLTQYQEMSHLRLSLLTGRTHQIRVHMASINHPLLGDDLYGGKRELISRQALHCTSLRFMHPVTLEERTFISSLPVDMKQVIFKQLVVNVEFLNNKWHGRRN